MKLFVLASICSVLVACGSESASNAPGPGGASGGPGGVIPGGPGSSPDGGSQDGGPGAGTSNGEVRAQIAFGAIPLFLAPLGDGIVVAGTSETSDVALGGGRTVTCGGACVVAVLYDRDLAPRRHWVARGTRAMAAAKAPTGSRAFLSVAFGASLASFALESDDATKTRTIPIPPAGGIVTLALNASFDAEWHHVLQATEGAALTFQPRAFAVTENVVLTPFGATENARVAYATMAGAASTAIASGSWLHALDTSGRTLGVTSRTLQNELRGTDAAGGETFLWSSGAPGARAIRRARYDRGTRAFVDETETATSFTSVWARATTGAVLFFGQTQPPELAYGASRVPVPAGAAQAAFLVDGPSVSGFVVAGTMQQYAYAIDRTPADDVFVAGRYMSADAKLGALAFPPAGNDPNGSFFVARTRRGPSGYEPVWVRTGASTRYVPLDALAADPSTGDVYVGFAGETADGGPDLGRGPLPQRAIVRFGR